MFPNWQFSGSQLVRELKTIGRGLSSKISTQLLHKAQLLSEQKKSASRVLLPSAGAVRSWGWLCWYGINFGASGADDLIGSAEDFLGALFGDRFRVNTVPSAEPILNAGDWLM
jgi:hypothetical protein